MSSRNFALAGLDAGGHGVEYLLVGLVEDVGIHTPGDGGVFMAQGLADIHQGDAGAVGQAGEGVPLRYNYDKPEKPRRIKA